jgi:hypothetical protein
MTIVNELLAYFFTLFFMLIIGLIFLQNVLPSLGGREALIFILTVFGMIYIGLL